VICRELPTVGQTEGKCWVTHVKCGCLPDECGKILPNQTMLQRKVFTLKHIPLTALEVNSSHKPNSTQKACFVLNPNLFLLFIMLTFIAVTQEISRSSFIHYTENLLNCSSVLRTQQTKVFEIFQEKMYKAIVDYRPLEGQNMQFLL